MRWEDLMGRQSVGDTRSIIFHENDIRDRSDL
jgi:hypothetical protein